MTKNNKVSNRKIDSGNEMGKFLLMVIVVTVLFILFYGITIFITNKKENKENNSASQSETIQYEKILIGNLLTQSDEKYYVLIQDQEDDNLDLYKTYLQLYKSVKDNKTVYFADLNHPMNVRFQGETTNTDITDILDLKIKATTLVYVEKGKILKSYDNKEELVTVLKELAQIKEEKVEE